MRFVELPGACRGRAAFGGNAIAAGHPACSSEPINAVAMLPPPMNAMVLFIRSAQRSFSVTYFVSM